MCLKNYPYWRRSHVKFESRENGPGPGTEIRRPALKTSPHSHEQSGTQVLSIGASMSALTDP